MDEYIVQELRRRDKWDVRKHENGVKRITLLNHMRAIIGDDDWNEYDFDSALVILDSDPRIMKKPGDYNSLAFKMYRLVKDEDPIWIQKRARIRRQEQQQIRNQLASVAPVPNGMQDDDGDTTMQVNDERLEEIDHDDDGGVLIAAPGMAPLVVPSRDDIGGELSDAPAPGVAPPVNPDSAVAMEVDNQDVAVSRHAEQRAPDEARIATSHHAPVDASAPSLDDDSMASEDEACVRSLHDASITSEDDVSSSYDPEDNSDHDAEERVDDVDGVDALVADDNPLYHSAQVVRPNLIEQMEEFVHQFDEFDIRINEGRSGGVVTQPPTHVLERFGRFPLADVIDDKRNMNDDLLLKKAIQIKNDLSIPLAERSAIVKAIEYHRGICALAVEQSKEKKTLGYREFFAKYKGLGWERHHIVPRSCNGTNDDVNLVYISKTKHIKVHGYLSMMCTDSALAAAFCFMTSQGGCDQRGVEIRDVVALLNDEGLLEELAIARSVHSTNLRVAHEKKRTGSVLDKFETKVRKTCLSFLYFVFIFVHYL